MAVTQQDRSATKKFGLAQALRARRSSFVAVTTTYQTNVCIVNTYVNNVMNTYLPTVPVQPKDWQDYVTAWEQANGVALSWVNTCMARLLNVPQDVQDYNPTISALLQDAIVQTQALIANPGNQAAKLALENDLRTLPQQLQLVETFVSGAIAALQGFQDQLPTMATDLQQISNLAIADNNADQAQIQALQQQVKQLQSDIDSLTAEIIALGIADAAALTLGLIASIAAFPVGLATWLVFGPIVAVATTFIALDAKKIEADKDAIDAAQTNMDNLTASCSVLATMSTTYSTLADQSQTIQTALKAVLVEWQALSSDIAVALTDIQTAVNDESSANYEAVLSDLEGALSEWNSAYAQAGSLVLNLQVNTAQLQVGMSQSDVQSALAGGQTVDLITYFNQKAA
jgi:hypothetical protein